MSSKSTNTKQNKQGIDFQAGDALWRNVFKKNDDQHQTTLALLKKVPIFTGMRKSELREFAKIMHIRRYAEGETIFYEGEPGVGMYIIQEGKISIFREVTGSIDEELAQLAHGEFFGELALLDESPRSAAAKACEDSEVIGLFRPDLIDLIERKPRLGNKLLFELARLIGERLKHTNEELQTLWARLDDSKVIT